MSKRNMMETYYTLFLLTLDDPRITPRKITNILEYSGRGHSPSTFMRHMNNMYKKRISLEPRIVLKPFHNSQTTLYFCRKKDRYDVFSTFLDLYADPCITYVILLSGLNFLVTTREKDLDLEKYNLIVEEESLFYSPIYTIPKGWNVPFSTAFADFLSSNFIQGKVPREIFGNLEWTSLEWGIFNEMKENIRSKFDTVARKITVDPKTVKKHFFEKVLPSCVIENFFFPKGYSSYKQMYIRLTTDFEQSIVEALGKLPCTSYVFPLEHEIDVNLFHENESLILLSLKKLKEAGMIDDYLLYVPVAYGF